MAERRAYLYHDKPTRYNYMLGVGSHLRSMLHLSGFSFLKENGFKKLIVHERGERLERFFTSKRIKELRGKGVWVKIR